MKTMKRYSRHLFSTRAPSALALVALGMCGSVSAIGAEASNDDPRGNEQAAVGDSSLIGAQVVGPGAGNLGVVEGLVVDQRTGEVAMYLVKAQGWFGDYGVVPVGQIQSRETVEEGGESIIKLTAKVNKATFRNTAKWNGEGSVARYIREYRELLSTLYGFDASQLDAEADNYSLKPHALSPALVAKRER